MPRSSWNPNTPDVVGVEFLGVGIANNIIQTNTQMRALRFKPQRTGEVDQVAVYAGALTSNPPLVDSKWVGHRKPWIIELIPVSGFDPGGVHTITTYQSAITASSNVVDEGGTPPEGNELAVRNDGLFLFNSGSTPSQVTVHMLNANTFPLDRHVTSIAIEASSLRNMNVRRIDQTNDFLWTRLFAAGFTTWHMGEAYIEHGTTGPYRLWSPQNVREFNSAVGNRRLRYNALDTQNNVMDLLRIHVDHIPERRAGVAVVEPPGTYQWVLGDLHAPNVTGAPATVVAGQDYIVLIRVPAGDGDYGADSSKLDLRSMADLRPNGGFQHYTFLDWDLHDVVLWEGNTPRALGPLVDGLLPLRLINDNQQTVDTQPYSASTSGVVPFKSSTVLGRAKQRLDVPAGTTEYRQLRVNMFVFDSPTAPEDKKQVNISLVNDLGATIAGPFAITEAMVNASPAAGSDLFGDDYRTVTVDFGAGIDINEANGVTAEFLLAEDYGEPGKTNITWRIGTLISEIAPITGSDQTAVVSGNGFAFIPPTNVFLNINNPGITRGDLQVSLLSQAPEITGIGVTGMSQPVTGGVCDPCPPFETPDCAVTSIAFNRICWSATTLTQDKFGYYELQRKEHAVHDHTGAPTDWITIAIISPTGSPVTGAPATGVPTCWDDWTMVYDTEVCYRVRQQRVDGTLSDFVEEACITTNVPNGADIVITSPQDPSLNVAFPEAHGPRLPIELEWDVLDAEQHVLRAVYGRDKHISFRPLERLGLRFRRRLLISALCTPVKPCIQVTDKIHEICQASVGYLVVRDRCGNRWYAAVNVPTLTQVHDPDLGDLWLADIEVTELATPVVTPENAGDVSA